MQRPPKSERELPAVLPLRGLWRAGLLAAWDFQALHAAGLTELGQVSQFSHAELLRLPGLDRAAVARIEALLGRYCLRLSPGRRPRFRRPGKRLDPY